MNTVEDVVLPNDIQQEISDILIKLLRDGCAASFLKFFKKRSDPYDIFSQSTAEHIKKLKGILPHEELLNYLCNQPIIHNNLCREGIYL